MRVTSKYSNTVCETEKGSKKTQSVADPCQATHSSLSNTNQFWVLGRKIKEKYSFLHFSTSLTIEGTHEFFERRRPFVEIIPGTNHIQLELYRY